MKNQKIMLRAKYRACTGFILAAFALLSPGLLHVHAAPPGLKVKYNYLENGSTGAIVRLTGVNIPSLQWGPGENITASVNAALGGAWKGVNIIRLPVDQAKWLAGGTYLTTVDGVVNQASGLNAYVLLDLHGFGQPDNNSLTFWTQAATRYKNNPAVLFGLFNEPHSTTWAVWKDGDATHPGLQDLYNAVRATGAGNLVTASGLNWANDISGAVNGYALTGTGIIYETHIYPWDGYWAAYVGCTANKYPVMVGEVAHPGQTTYPGIPGSFEDYPTWNPKIMDFMDERLLNWTSWAFYPSSGPPGLPSMLTDWNFTPNTWWGQPAQSRFLNYLKPYYAHTLGGTVITDGTDAPDIFVNPSGGAVHAFGMDGGKIFQSSLGNGGWVGLDMLVAHQITSVSYVRGGASMVGGVFQGANISNFSDAVTLATITVDPPTGWVWTTSTVNNTTKFRYVRYLGPNGSYCKVDEIKISGIN